MPTTIVADAAAIPLNGRMSRFARITDVHATQRSGCSTRTARRRGAAVVELAVMLPLLVLLFLVTVDFARVYYYSLTLTNCARNGALYASDPTSAVESPFPNVVQAARSDAANLSPPPQISQNYGIDASGRNYVEVTATYTFSTMTKFPIIPSDLQLTRTVRMFVAANTPNAN
jgi:Flp pilus assembly protein TadG